MDRNGGSYTGQRRARRRAVQRRLGIGIRTWRREKGWSRADLAERLGVPWHNLAKWETGAHAPPLNELESLLEVLEVTYEELIQGQRASAPVLPAKQRNELAVCMNRLLRAVRPLLQSPEPERTKEEE